MRDVLLKILAAVEALAPAEETTPAAEGGGDAKEPVEKETETKEEPTEEPAPETTKKRSVSK